MESSLFAASGTPLNENLSLLLCEAGLFEKLSDKTRVLIKPNLVEAINPPVTTPVDIVGEIVGFIQRELPSIEIIVADGTGSLDYDTAHVFTELGYEELALKYNVSLVDLNKEESVRLEVEGCARWPELYLPKIALESFLISVPVLKAHTLAGVTLTMKNMVGLAPPNKYQQGGHWRKSAFHTNIDEAVFDLNRYRSADFTILDAREGMSEAHLWGRKLDPPPGLIVAGTDVVKIDAYGARLLKRNWQDVGHLRLADGVLGEAEPNEPSFVGVAGGSAGSSSA